MIDFNKPIETRNGLKVTLYPGTIKHSHCFVGYITFVNGQQMVSQWDASGINGLNYDHNLKNVKEKKVGWINIYPAGSISAVIFVSEDAATRYASQNRVACVKVEWLE